MNGRKGPPRFFMFELNGAQTGEVYTRPYQRDQKASLNSGKSEVRRSSYGRGIHLEEFAASPDRDRLQTKT
jgi:hypothetical protein